MLKLYMINILVSYFFIHGVLINIQANLHVCESTVKGLK